MGVGVGVGERRGDWLGEIYLCSRLLKDNKLQLAIQTTYDRQENHIAKLPFSFISLPTTSVR